MELLTSLLQLVRTLLNPIIFIPAAIIISVRAKGYWEYKSSTYYQATRLPYRSVRYNTGRYGEYLTYKQLRHFEDNGAKFLFNLYIPKGNGETTEIDLLMICQKGVFVFESKNYSGWIFGAENQKIWCQTLPTGRGRSSHKEQFYNPVLQNKSHIKHLKSLFDEPIPTQSIIVFSDRCTLKSVQFTSRDIRVINRYDVDFIVSNICKQSPANLLSENNVMDIYNKLYPFTQASEATKAQHNANIQRNLNSEICQQDPSDHDSFFISPGTGTATNSTPIPAAESPKMKPSEHHPIEHRTFKCPSCGGNLVLRTATKGRNIGNRFYGCSNFPKCKYIQNISNHIT